ncbi:MAG TPA: hypothetical protein PKA82_14075 [Pyrinomonadaceae bacterium]|nr:hypothetical protein [Pyrinomonadaceae bacterium]
MSKNVKILLVILGIFALLAIGCVGGMYLLGTYAIDNEAITKARNDGLEFGRSTDNAGCDVKIGTMLSGVKLTELSKGLAVQYFFDGCLETSKKTPGYCDGVANAFADIFNDDKGKEAQCRKIGYVDSPVCRNVIDEKLDFCSGL